MISNREALPAKANLNVTHWKHSEIIGGSNLCHHLPASCQFYHTLLVCCAGSLLWCTLSLWGIFQSHCLLLSRTPVMVVRDMNCSFWSFVHHCIVGLYACKTCSKSLPVSVAHLSMSVQWSPKTSTNYGHCLQLTWVIKFQRWALATLSQTAVAFCTGIMANSKQICKLIWTLLSECASCKFCCCEERLMCSILSRLFWLSQERAVHKRNQAELVLVIWYR